MHKPVLIMSAAALILGLMNFYFVQDFDLKSSIKRGESVYANYCLSCHMDQGQGIEMVYPPLAKADYLMADSKRSIRIVLYGANGEMRVNGKTYNLEMTGFSLSDKEASDVLNYVRNSWGNKGAAITPEDIEAARDK